ncbi:MAG: type II toxin-antitoxin system RelE family toxin [Chloroflexota bacterium]
MPSIDIPKRFKKRLQKKPPELVSAILEAIDRLIENPSHPGLKVHPVQGTTGVFEAYIDLKNRLTFEFGPDGSIVLRNHCNHDILKRP